MDGSLSLATYCPVTCEPVLEVHDRVEDGVEWDGEEGPALGLHQQQVTRHLANQNNCFPHLANQNNCFPHLANQNNCFPHLANQNNCFPHLANKNNCLPHLANQNNCYPSPGQSEQVFPTASLKQIRLLFPIENGKDTKLRRISILFAKGKGVFISYQISLNKTPL
jgi:hypothetical protein